MRDRLIRRKLPRDCYSRAITVLYGKAADINAVLQKELGESTYNLTPTNLGKWVCYEQEKGSADYICIVRRGSAGARFSTLSHECLHCAINTLRAVGITLTTESEEAYTYYHQWLVIQCLLVMRGSDNA